MSPTTNNLLSSIWVEKYRPHSLDECLMNDDLRKKFNDLKKLNHFIFTGSYGMGKTTIARILAKKFAGDNVLVINAADENGIDTVRTKIHDFMSYMSLDSEYKVVILNEASYLTKSAQEALRNPLEEYSESCRFIFTANDLEAIDDAIKSRCQVFEFTPPPINEVGKLVQRIAKNEGIILSKEDNPGLIELIKTYFPDIRKTTNEFEKCCLSGKFIWEKADNWMDELYDMLVQHKPHLEIRTWFIKSHYNRSMSFTPIYQYLFKRFSTNDCVVVLLAEYLERKVIDEEINFAAFLIQMEKILKL